VASNIPRDPFERLSILRSGPTINTDSPEYLNDFMAREFWCFVLLQWVVARAGASAIEYPPVQDSSSFILDAFKTKIAAAIKSENPQYSHSDNQRPWWQLCCFLTRLLVKAAKSRERSMDASASP
jgi:hypothetical protein